MGVSKKINTQIKCFEKNTEIEEINIKSTKSSIVRRILNIIPFISNNQWDYHSAFNKIINPDFIYIRRNTADKKYFSFFKEIKSKYPNCKIIFEFYTYPYERDEYMKFTAWPFYFKDCLYRKYYKNFADRIVTYSKDLTIFDVKTINTFNGIDFQDVSVSSREKCSKVINLITVANFQRHHGCERMIKGLYRYYNSGGTRPIHYHLIGEGRECEKYKKLVSKYNLSNHVTFHGSIVGEALENMYNMANLAVTSLGMYKIGIDFISTIKEQEFAAKGLPIVGGCETALSNYGWYWKVNNSSETIDIISLIAWYDNLLESITEIQSVEDVIRNDASEVVDINITMKPILDYLEV